MRSQHLGWRAPSRPQSRRAVALVALVVVVLATLALGATPRASADATTGQRDRVRRERAEKAGQLDALRAEQGQIDDALSALDANLDSEQAQAIAAARAEQLATAEATEARDAETAKQAEIATLETEARKAALNLYMGSTGTAAATLFPGADVSSAMYQAVLTELAVGGAQTSIDALDAARQDLAVSRARAERAQAHATAQRQASEEQAVRLQEAIALSERKQGELDDRIDQNLAEAASLANLDVTLSKQIAAREAAIAARLRESERLAAARAANAPGGGGAPRMLRSESRPEIVPVGGHLVMVHGIKVDASIAGALSALIAAAAGDGFALGGNGYRSADQQIAVRRSNCGPSQYDIWQKPASQCRPPAARPGTSMHERGLAIDFTCNGSLIASYGSSCYGWMRAHAPSLGFLNRPGEAWHWSPNGH